MSKFETFINHKSAKVLVFVLTYIGWLFPYVFREHLLTFEMISQILVASFACLCLLLCKDTFIVLEVILLFPFMFARPLNLYIIPTHLYFIVGMVLASFIAHFVIHKTKFTFPKFMIGFIAIGISLVLGGLLIDYDDKVIKMILLGAIAIAFLAFYVCFVSSTKPKFTDLAFIMMLLGSLLMLQYLTWATLNPDDLFVKKLMYFGWASNSNNVAMMLLFTFPFIWYLGYISKGIKSFLYFLLSFVNIVIIIVSYSRGSILSIGITCVLMLICLGIYKPSRSIMLKYAFAVIGGLFFSMITLALAFPVQLNAIIGNILAINLNNLNGRVPIYEMMIGSFSEQPIFGYGVYASYNEDLFYVWGHNTFVQTGYTLGMVGVLAMLWHHIEKYFYCFKKMNLEKAIILFAFIATDIYGFMDVSYFFINFMIVLLVVLIACDKIFDKEKVIDNATV